RTFSCSRGTTWETRSTPPTAPSTGGTPPASLAPSSPRKRKPQRSSSFRAPEETYTCRSAHLEDATWRGGRVSEQPSRGQCPHGRSTGRARTAGHAARALLRSRVRLRHHAGDELPLAQPDVGRSAPGLAAPRDALVVVVGVRLVDEYSRF